MAKNKDNDPPEDELPDDFFDDENDDDGEENGFSENFDDAELSEEEMKAERQERRDRVFKHKVYAQAEEVYRITEALVASMQNKSTEDKMEEGLAAVLMESAMMLRPKIAGIIGSRDYIYAMQNAAIIRHHAEHLRLSTNTLHHFTNVDRNHCKIHRQEMEKFRKIFSEWMNEVKQYEKIMDDEWNVF